MKKLIRIGLMVFLLQGKNLVGQALQGHGPIFKVPAHNANPMLTKDSFQSQSSCFSMVKVPVFSGPKLPQGAVFCRMEEHLWNKFNVWIKFRAGNDEMYRKLIETQ